jgi:hypothetical protein
MSRPVLAAEWFSTMADVVAGINAAWSGAVRAYRCTLPEFWYSHHPFYPPPSPPNPATA